MSDEVVVEFLVESNENLDRLDRELVQLERDPGNRETLASIFRTIHTIKGTCGFLGFTKLESVAHVGEGLLSRLRDGKLALSQEIATALLQMVDAIRQMLRSVEASGHEGERDDKTLIETLTKLQREPAELVCPGSQSSPSEGAASENRRKAPQNENSDSQRTPRPQATDAGPTASDEYEQKTGQQTVRSSVSEASIRVDVVLLDKLMNLVGELVLARNQILQFTNTREDAGLLASSQRLNLITTELQEGVMKTRMQPIGNIWSKFPRTVRDVAASCGKQIRIEMEGKETELDKTIIEAIKDPLTHIVRNSSDHGIETPEKRVDAGKPPEGKLLLRAYHEGGQVNIEISDDGAGLDADKIRKKALEKGLITPDHAADLSEREAVNLIFLPGFSTAEKITNVSGRGVGMDVVRTNIEKIGGAVDVSSKAGIGTTVKMKIPLTLAIIPALIVTSAGERYAIPQISLLELVRLEGENSAKIELVQGVPVYRLRGRLLPLVNLNRELKVASGNAPDAEDSVASIVVLQAEDRQFGLIVDEINDTEEIVVKPLSKQLKGIKTFAGSTIMGDGRVALILDVLGVAQVSNVVSEARTRALAEKEAAQTANLGARQTLLLFSGPDEERMAVPLDSVGRLEEFPASAVERTGASAVVQYRGEILPLLFLSELLQERRKHFRHSSKALSEAGDRLQGIVYLHEGKRFGLVIDRILDIVDEVVQVKSAASRFGVLYTAVIQGRVTELLDIPALLQNRESKKRSSHREQVEV